MSKSVYAAAATLILAACSSPENDKDLRAAFADVLKDPSSVQFQRVNETDKAICGDYNAKNSYGAYDGFEAFVFDRSTKQLSTEKAAENGNGYKDFLDRLGECDKQSKIFFGIVERQNAKS